MMELRNVSKKFDEIVAVNQVSLTIQDGKIFGLLGTNGAGKSTLLRMMSGVIKEDAGDILCEGIPIWNNLEVLRNIFYISDHQFYFPNGDTRDLVAFYKNYYPEFDEKRFYKILLRFDLDSRRKIKTFSKGMKKQIAILLGVCSNAKYLFCDETFDGLDPVMRQGIKSIFAREMEERGLTPVIASHNLRELEDICDQIGVLHKGGMLLSRDLEELKSNFVKVQCVLPEEMDGELRGQLDVIKMNRHGRLVTMTIRGNAEEVLSYIASKNPVYYEGLPLSLEEIFISEMEVVGYEIKNLIF